MEFLGFSLHSALVVPALVGLVAVVLSVLSAFKER